MYSCAELNSLFLARLYVSPKMLSSPVPRPICLAASCLSRFIRPKESFLTWSISLFRVVISISRRILSSLSCLILASMRIVVSMASV